LRSTPRSFIGYQVPASNALMLSSLSEVVTDSKPGNGVSVRVGSTSPIMDASGPLLVKSKLAYPTPTVVLNTALPILPTRRSRALTVKVSVSKSVSTPMFSQLGSTIPKVAQSSKLVVSPLNSLRRPSCQYQNCRPQKRHQGFERYLAMWQSSRCQETHSGQLGCGLCL